MYFSTKLAFPAWCEIVKIAQTYLLPIYAQRCSGGLPFLAEGPGYVGASWLGPGLREAMTRHHKEPGQKPRVRAT